MMPLFATTLKWGLSHIADADDMLLAMVSPQAYWLLREWRRETFGDQEATRGMLMRARQQLLQQGMSEDALRGATVSVRTKGLFSTFHKAVVRKQKVHDVLAVRVVLRRGLEAEQLYEAHGAIRRLYPTRDGRYKDYVARPKANGYRALHYTMLLPSGQAFEVQIRTRGMHLEAEYGLAAHRRYKGALARLPMAVMSGVALVPSSLGMVEHTMRWPVPGEAALDLATRLAA
jgi:GTP pyrophosphokinase